MRPAFRAAILVSLAFGLAGCSTTSGSKSWWPPFSSKSKNATSNLASSNAPQAPAFNSTANAAPQVSMPGGYPNTAAPSYYGGTQYPVTPYPSTGAGASNAAYTAGAAASNGYMPPSDPYAAPAPANPYATAANPYAAAAPPASAYPSTGQQSASAYPGAPTSGGDSPYSYTR